MQAAPSPARSWTAVGLSIALIGLPAVALLFRLLSSDPAAVASVVLRETAILGLVAVLIWIILNGERLPLSSIGLSRQGIGRSLGWGLVGAVMLAAGLAASLAAFAATGLSYGSGSGAIATSRWATLLTVIRAGTAEEIFYRGYAIERLNALTANRWIAAVIPLLCFAGFHYRQGIAGIVLALVLGGILTGLYLWKRNLVANMFAHFLVDFVPNVLLPLIGGD